MCTNQFKLKTVPIRVSCARLGTCGKVDLCLVFWNPQREMGPFNLVVSDTLLFWSWLNTFSLKLDLVQVGKFFFHFSPVFGSLTDYVMINVDFNACVV